MNPEDRVLVGVINRKRDFLIARDDHWYRIPQDKMPDGINVEYIAFFLSGKAFKDQSGGIYYYAPISGVELALRRDLLPRENDHPHVDRVYYRVALGELREKHPPILNPTRRVISFIFTTWDRFAHATQISDLYSTADHFVDRVYYALQSQGIESHRIWEAEKNIADFAPGVSIPCKRGVVNATVKENPTMIYMDMSQPEDTILAAIRAEIERQGGPVTINIPLEGK